MATEAQPAPLLHDIPGACRELGIGRSTLYELIDRGDIPIVKLGRRTLLAHDALRAYVDRLTAGSVA